MTEGGKRRDGVNFIMTEEGVRDTKYLENRTGKAF